MPLLNNQKLISIMPIALFAPTLAMAATNFSNGYYAGVSGGVSQSITRFSQTTDLIYNARGLTTIKESLPFTDDFNINGIGVLYFGAGWFLPQSDFYLAAELYGSWSKNRNEISKFSTDNDEFLQTVQIHSSIKSKLNEGELGFDLRPGYLLDLNTMLYGRIGVAFNQVKNTIDHEFNFASFSIITGPDFRFQGLHGTKKQVKPALRLGAGLEHKVAKTASLTADYIYTYYGKLHTARTGDITTAGENGDVIFNPNARHIAGSTKMRTNTFLVGVKYYFPQWG